MGGLGCGVLRRIRTAEQCECDTGDQGYGKCGDAECQSPATPVDLGRKWALRFEIQHELTVRPGHRQPSDPARRVAVFARVSALFADIAEVLAQRDPTIGKAVGQTDDRQLGAFDPVGDGT